MHIARGLLVVGACLTAMAWGNTCLERGLGQYNLGERTQYALVPPCEELVHVLALVRVGEECQEYVVERLGVSYRITLGKGWPGAKGEADLMHASVRSTRTLKACMAKTYERRDINNGSHRNFGHSIDEGVTAFRGSTGVLDRTGRCENVFVCLHRMDSKLSHSEPDKGYLRSGGDGHEEVQPMDCLGHSLC